MFFDPPFSLLLPTNQLPFSLVTNPEKLGEDPRRKKGRICNGVATWRRWIWILTWLPGMKVRMGLSDTGFVMGFRSIWCIRLFLNLYLLLYYICIIYFGGLGWTNGWCGWSEWVLKQWHGSILRSRGSCGRWCFGWLGRKCAVIDFLTLQIKSGLAEGNFTGCLYIISFSNSPFLFAKTR